MNIAKCLLSCRRATCGSPTSSCGPFPSSSAGIDGEMTVGRLATLFLRAVAQDQVGSPCIAFAPALADRVHFQHGQPASALVRKAHGKE
jgi:hypothetical protein